MPVIREPQPSGYLLNGHIGGKQQILGDLHPAGKVVMIGCHLIFLFEQMRRPGDGQMDMGGNVGHGQIGRQVLLDEIFHQQPAGGLQHLTVVSLGKAADMAVEQKSQFFDAISRFFFHDLQNLLQVLSFKYPPGCSSYPLADNRPLNALPDLPAH